MPKIFIGLPFNVGTYSVLFILRARLKQEATSMIRRRSNVTQVLSMKIEILSKGLASNVAPSNIDAIQNQAGVVDLDDNEKKD